MRSTKDTAENNSAARERLHTGGESMPKTSNYAYGAYSPELYSVVRETLHRLGDLDYHYAAELGQVETSLSDEEIKKHIKQRILAAHQKLRQPYIELLTALRLKHGL
jgi:hypothetical protein